MRWIDRLERKLRRYAIPNITVYLIAGQVLFFLFAMSGRFVLGRILLVPSLVLAGEWWRLITFLFIPPPMNLIFAFFAWYLFYLMGSALENRWGTFRYNLFLLIGYIVTVAVSFLFPFAAATNVFIGGSVFLAFAYLYPDFQLFLFFIIPVRIKWLALVTWLWYGYEMLVGSWDRRLLVLASISNFLLFFGRDIIWMVRTRNRKMVFHAKQYNPKNEPFHKCTVCGKTDVSHPQMEFRYCSECGGLGYCKDHIFNHEHRKS